MVSERMFNTEIKVIATLTGIHVSLSSIMGIVWLTTYKTNKTGAGIR